VLLTGHDDDLAVRQGGVDLLDGGLEERRAVAAEEKQLLEHNAQLVRSIEALRSDVGAIEDRARADLGMVYPGELVLRVAPAAGQVTP